MFDYMVADYLRDESLISKTSVTDLFHVVNIQISGDAHEYYYFFEKEFNEKDCWEMIREKHSHEYDDSVYDIEVIERNGCFSIEEFDWKERLQEEEHQEFIKSLEGKSRQELSELILKYTEILNNDNYEYDSWQDAYSYGQRLIAIAKEIKECL